MEAQGRTRWREGVITIDQKRIADGAKLEDRIDFSRKGTQLVLSAFAAFSS